MLIYLIKTTKKESEMTYSPPSPYRGLNGGTPYNNLELVVDG